MRYHSDSYLPKLLIRTTSATVALVGVMWASQALGQVNVNVPGVNVSVGGNGQGNVNVSVGGKNKVGNTAGNIEEDVEMEGVTIINGAVTIDGEKVPKGKTRHTGKKSGIKYLIKWGKDGNVAVSQE